MGALYDWLIQHERIGDRYLRLIVGEELPGFLGVMEAVAAMPDGTTILDVPCGGGITLRRLRPDQRVHYVAADISATMLRRAREHVAAGAAATVHFVECDITSMPFEDNEFDLVICFSGLHCLPDPAAAVREMARCVRVGGRVIADIALHGQLRRTDIFMGLGRAAGVFGPAMTIAEVRRWFCDAGLSIDTITRAGALAYVEARR